MRCWLPITLLLLGCATWNAKEPASVPSLPRTQMSRNSVGVEVATVTLDVDSFPMLEQIIAELDEQVLAPEFRRHLALNGFRGGRIGLQLPSEIEFLLLEAADRREHPTADTIGDPPDQQRFIQCRPGRKVRITLWGNLGRLHAKHHDGELSIGEDLSNAACKFALQTSQDGNGGATVLLTPEIEHGDLRQQYVANDGAFHMEARRDEISYDDLQMTFALRPGETLLVTCNDLPDMLGQRFFRNAAATKQKLLLVRLAQTQVDIDFDGDDVERDADASVW